MSLLLCCYFPIIKSTNTFKRYIKKNSRSREAGEADSRPDALYVLSTGGRNGGRWRQRLKPRREFTVLEPRGAGSTDAWAMRSTRPHLLLIRSHALTSGHLLTKTSNISKPGIRGPFCCRMWPPRSRTRDLSHPRPHCAPQRRTPQLVLGPDGPRHRPRALCRPL